MGGVFPPLSSTPILLLLPLLPTPAYVFGLTLVCFSDLPRAPAPSHNSMFHFKRDAPSQSRQPEKPRSRPRSLSTRSSSSSSLSASAAANLHLLPRRAPLAPLDPQSTNGPLTASDDQMSSASSSSAFLGYNPADDSRDPDRARYNIGKPIIPRAGIDELAGNLPSSRRRSIPNQCVIFSHKSIPPSHIPFSERKVARPCHVLPSCNNVPSHDAQHIRHRPRFHPLAEHLFPPSSISRQLRRHRHRQPPPPSATMRTS